MCVCVCMYICTKMILINRLDCPMLTQKYNLNEEIQIQKLSRHYQK